MTAKKTATTNVTKPRVRVRKPAAKKSAADTALASKVLDMLDAATTPGHVPIPEIDTDTLARAVDCIPDVETLDQMCERIAEANRRAHTV